MSEPSIYVSVLRCNVSRIQYLYLCIATHAGEGHRLLIVSSLQGTISRRLLGTILLMTTHAIRLQGTLVMAMTILPHLLGEFSGDLLHLLETIGTMPRRPQCDLLGM